MWRHIHEERNPPGARHFGDEKNLLPLTGIAPLLISCPFRSIVTIYNELSRLFMPLRWPTQTLHLRVKLLSLIKWKFLYIATAKGLHAVRRVSAEVQAELLWPPATSKHNFLLSLQRHHASLAPEKEPPLFVQLT